MINSLSINLTLLITNQPGVILPHGPPAKWHNPQKCCQAFVEGEEYGRTWRKPSEQGNNQQHSAHIWLQLWGSNQKSCIFCYRKVVHRYLQCLAWKMRRWTSTWSSSIYLQNFSTIFCCLCIQQSRLGRRLQLWST